MAVVLLHNHNSVPHMLVHEVNPEVVLACWTNLTPIDYARQRPSCLWRWNTVSRDPWGGSSTDPRSQSCAEYDGGSPVNPTPGTLKTLGSAPTVEVGPDTTVTHLLYVLHRPPPSDAWLCGKIDRQSQMFSWCFPTGRTGQRTPSGHWTPPASTSPCGDKEAIAGAEKCHHHLHRSSVSVGPCLRFQYRQHPVLYQGVHSPVEIMGDRGYVWSP